MKLKLSKLTPPQFLILSLLIAIMISTILLRLPFSTIESINWRDSLFMSTSFLTVTGLTVVNISTTFTLFGQIIILLIIKLGGLGIMLFSIFIFLMLGKKIGIKERVMIQQSLNLNSLGGLLRLVKQIFLYSLVIELTATLILSIRWIPEYGFLRGLYYSFFHAVSAFNNAGISLWPNSLMAYRTDVLITLIISSLFIIGGLGFTVLMDITAKKRFKDLSLHSKLMIVGTIVINVVTTFIIFGLEFQNPDTLGGLPSLGNQLLAAYFQATNIRTAGFTIIDLEYFHEATLIFTMLLMFIGAGSASSAGGIRLTTFLVIILSFLTFLNDKKQLTIGYRGIKDKVIFRSFAILSISIFFTFFSLFILTVTESAPASKLLFEVVSAFGTTGFTLGMTELLSPIGRMIIIGMMFLGKIGALTLAFSLTKPKKDKIRYPSEDILTG